MAAGNVLTGGFGISGGLTGTASLVLSLGYGIGALAITSRAFYRPLSTDVADVRSRSTETPDRLSRSVDVTDVRSGGVDEQV